MAYAAIAPYFIFYAKFTHYIMKRIAVRPGGEGANELFIWIDVGENPTVRHEGGTPSNNLIKDVPHRATVFVGPTLKSYKESSHGFESHILFFFQIQKIPG